MCFAPLKFAKDATYFIFCACPAFTAKDTIANNCYFTFYELIDKSDGIKNVPTILFMPISHQKTCRLLMYVCSQDWWEKFLVMEFDDNDCKENFRISLRSLYKLCGIMENVTKPCDPTVHTPLLLATRVAIVFYKLGSCCDYRVVMQAIQIAQLYN